ncbi:MAG: DUF2007 domain-containing protein [Dehalococcoidia bacterium]|nr:DUF2007 domain-containing protein [Dehalococcoidia bacterium]
MSQGPANGQQAARQPAVVVAVAGDAIQAAIWHDALEDAGIEAAVYERGVGAALGGASAFGASYPLLVDRGDVAAARNIIADLGGAVALAPVHDDRAARERRQRALLVAGAIVAVILALGVLSRLLT